MAVKKPRSRNKDGKFRKKRKDAKKKRPGKKKQDLKRTLAQVCPYN